MTRFWLTAFLTVPLAMARSTQRHENCSSSILQLVYPNLISDINPGDLLPIEDLTEAPRLYLPRQQSRAQTYLVMMVHPDININGTLVDLVHWIQPDLRADGAPPAIELVNNSATTGNRTPYLAPAPPASIGIQEYYFYLFSQPSSWTFPSSFDSINPPADVEARIGFDMDRFVEESGLGTPLATNSIRTKTTTDE